MEALALAVSTDAATEPLPAELTTMSSGALEVYVGYLRKKLRRDVVETIRGAGYRFRG